MMVFEPYFRCLDDFKPTFSEFSSINKFCNESKYFLWLDEHLARFSCLSIEIDTSGVLFPTKFLIMQ